MPTRWALLVGVDYYSPGKSRPVEFSNLSECVQDVLAFEKYFRDVLKVTKIFKLVSPLDRSTAAQELPTCHNIVRKLKYIADTGRPGDLVYIHYSGHGIRRSRKLPHDGGDNISGAALVPMDVMQGGAYLTGYQLGILVERLVRRKMRVAVTLDCCFSGRAFRRGDGNIRTSESPYDDSILLSDEEADKIVREENEEEGPEPPVNSESGYRNADVKLSWLVDPTDCSVLTACTVNQYAEESRFPEGKFGVLTYFVLQLLRQTRQTQLPSYEKLADYVSRKCLEDKFPQRPVIHGESGIEFFGRRSIFQRPNCNVLESDGMFVADIGRVSGVAIGASYKTVTFGSNDRDSQSKDQYLRVATVNEYNSIMELTNNSSDSSEKLRGHSSAFLRSWALPGPTYVDVKLPLKDYQLQNIKDLLQAQLSSVQNLFLMPPGKQPSLTICHDREGNFKFEDEQGQVFLGVPKIAYNAENTVCKIAYIARHLTRYQAIQNQLYGGERISLKPSTVSFKLESSRGIAWKRGKDGAYSAIDGDKVTLKFMNLTPNRPVHVAIFNLNPTWGIDKIYPAGAQPTEETHGTQPIVISDLTMEVPPHLGGDSIVDILRAYVYAGERPPSWDELALPNLPTEAHLIDVELPTESLVEDAKKPNIRNIRPTKNKAANVPPIQQDDDDIWTTVDIKIRTSRGSRGPEGQEAEY